MPRDKVGIRPMIESDLETIAEIERISGLEQWGSEAYNTDLKKDNALLYVAEMAKVVGFVSARLITSDVEIFQIAVSPEFRKQGIGGKLLQKILQIAEENGCQNCWLEVRESNKSARRFYKNLNFEIVGRRKNYYSFPAEDALLLEFKIKPEP